MLMMSPCLCWKPTGKCLAIPFDQCDERLTLRFRTRSPLNLPGSAVPVAMSGWGHSHRFGFVRFRRQRGQEFLRQGRDSVATTVRNI